MKTASKAERILQLSAYQLATASMENLYNPSESKWVSGFRDGRAIAACHVLKVFLPNMPRRFQLEIGTRIRSEILEFKVRLQRRRLKAAEVGEQLVAA